MLCTRGPRLSKLQAVTEPRLRLTASAELAVAKKPGGSSTSHLHGRICHREELRAALGMWRGQESGTMELDMSFSDHFDSSGMCCPLPRQAASGLALSPGGPRPGSGHSQLTNRVSFHVGMKQDPSVQLQHCWLGDSCVGWGPSYYSPCSVPT